jgi:hypothetical protein
MAEDNGGAAEHTPLPWRLWKPEEPDEYPPPDETDRRIVMVEGDTIVNDSYVEPLYAASALTSLSQENERLKASITDYEEVLADKRRLAREIDVALCGEEDAAPQASLCDLVKVAEMKRSEIESLSLRVKELEEALKHMLGAIDSGGIDSEEIDGDERNGIPPHKWHEEWASIARTVLHGEGDA